jgi:hypothetical protein
MQQWATSLGGVPRVAERPADRAERSRSRSRRGSSVRGSGSRPTRCGGCSRRWKRRASCTTGARCAGVGGPRFAYSLSGDGEALFPRAHAPTLVAALDFMREAHGPRRGDGVLPSPVGDDRRGGGAGARGAAAGGPGAAAGGAAHVAGLHGRGRPGTSCPRAGRRRAAGSCCASTTARCARFASGFRSCAPPRWRSLEEEVLGARLDRRAHLLAGCNRCEYRVVEHEGGGGGRRSARGRPRSRPPRGAGSARPQVLRPGPHGPRPVIRSTTPSSARSFTRSSHEHVDRCADQPRVLRRLRHGYRVGGDPARPERGHRPPHLAEEERARVAPRVAPEGVPPVADDDRAQVAERQLPEDRLPGHRLLLGAQDHEAARVARRGRPQAARDVQQARHPAQRAEGARGGGGGRRVRLGERGHHLPRGAGEGRGSSSARSARRCRSTRSWCASTSVR